MIKPFSIRKVSVSVAVVGVALAVCASTTSATASESTGQAPKLVAKKNASGQTQVTERVNKLLQPDRAGILVRAVPDNNETDTRVGSFVRNDLKTPTNMYPVASANCGAEPPSTWYGYDGNGTPYDYEGTLNGSNSGTNSWVYKQCMEDREDMGFPNGTDSYIQPAFGIVAKHSSKFTLGTYYFWDSNSLDARCWYNAQTGICEQPAEYPDLKNGPGEHSNPGACHSAPKSPGSSEGKVDQITATDPVTGVSLVTDTQTCQCNTGLSGNNWKDWVDHFLKYADPPADGWGAIDFFAGSDPNKSFDQPGGVNGKAPPGMIDAAACWTPGVDAMVAIQNQFWERRSEILNGQLPAMPAGKANWTDVDSMKYYFGWNEIPMKSIIDSRDNRIASIIKLPAGVKKLNDLSKSAKKNLFNMVKGAMQSTSGQDLFIPQDQRVVLNSKKQSKVIVMKQKYNSATGSWSNKAMCQNYTFNKNKPNKLQIKFKKQTNKAKGYCYLAGNLKP